MSYDKQVNDKSIRLFDPDDRKPWQRSDLPIGGNVEVEPRDLPALRRETIAATREGIQRSDENALEAWKEAANDVIETLCRVRGVGGVFTADDVWWMLEDRGIEPPREPRALGGRMQSFARQGRILNTRRLVKSQRPVKHGDWVVEWEVVT